MGSVSVGGGEEGLAVEARGLTKRYGSRVAAVDELNLSIRRGEVYGLLGPNGAGKTTTLRMLLGLVRPTSGTARVLGKPPGDPDGLARLGAIVESPAFYPFLSGRDNLRVAARRAGLTDARVEEALEEVKLAPRAKDKFGKYSSGMKQRLGVASALLKDPELLILDEPSNGLDPPGQVDMRNLLMDLGQSGRTTIVLSSHDLDEVEQLCGRVGMIGGGRLVAQGTVEELKGRGGGSGELVVRARPIEKALEVAGRMLGEDRVRQQVVSKDDETLRLVAKPSEAPSICRELVLANLEVSEIRHKEERSFEEVFIELTGGHAAGNGAGAKKSVVHGSGGGEE